MKLERIPIPQERDTLQYGALTMREIAPRSSGAVVRVRSDGRTPA